MNNDSIIDLKLEVLTLITMSAKMPVNEMVCDSIAFFMVCAGIYLLIKAIAPQGFF